MGQEAFDIEDCVQEKNKRKGDINMLRKTKRTLSLVLALIMICSTMGVMAFAAETAVLSECSNCGEELVLRKIEDWQFNRVIGCPLHNETHDAEEYYVHYIYRCRNCEWDYRIILDRIDYICLG